MISGTDASIWAWNVWQCTRRFLRYVCSTKRSCQELAANLWRLGHLLLLNLGFFGWRQVECRHLTFLWIGVLHARPLRRDGLNMTSLWWRNLRAIICRICRFLFGLRHGCTFRRWDRTTWDGFYLGRSLDGTWNVLRFWVRAQRIVPRARARYGRLLKLLYFRFALLSLICKWDLHFRLNDLLILTFWLALIARRSITVLAQLRSTISFLLFFIGATTSAIAAKVVAVSIFRLRCRGWFTSSSFHIYILTIYSVENSND